MSGRLADKVAIVTGAGGGIGRATAALFAAEGARLVLADLDAESGEESADNCSPPGDAVVLVEGIAERAGAVSTVTSTAIVNAISTEAAQELARRGVKPWVL